MNIAEITLICVVFSTLVTLWGVRVIALEVKHGVALLDSNIAAAIKALVDGDLLNSLEPINPIQQALSNLIMQKVQEGPIEIQSVTSRASDGKFRPE